MPNRDGINTAYHPGRQVGGMSWNVHDQPGRGPMMTAGYGDDGLNHEFSVIPQGGRSHGLFMAHYEQHSDEHPQNPGYDPYASGWSSGPYKNPERARNASLALGNRVQNRSESFSEGHRDYGPGR